VADGMFEQRRYTALVFQHDAVPDYNAFLKLLPSVRRAARVRLPKSSDWRAERFDYLAKTNLYPETVKIGANGNSNGFPHAMYYGGTSGLSTLTGPVTVIASPYVRLLNRVANDLRRKLPPPASRYLAIDMRRVYEAVAEGQPGITATRVTMQMLNEPTLELVSLAGKNPLHSDLHAALRKVAAPYSVRAEVEGDTGAARVNADRHGNLWWYQSDESRLERPLRLLEALDRWGALRVVRSLPLDRATEDEAA
jgi:hypothetical protein